MPVSMENLVNDWNDESTGLKSVLTGLHAADWDRQTPAVGWTVRHQVAHLSWTDDALQLALTAPDDFAALKVLVEVNTDAAVNQAAKTGANAEPDVLLGSWEAGRLRTGTAVLSADPSRRIPWFGPPMGLAAAVSARIMETFAHGQDIRDTFGLAPVGSERLRHIAHLGLAARAFSFQVNGLPVPEEPVRLELRFDGAIWTWGPQDASQRVVGDALDFALLVTRRRHRSDCNVEATGVEADQWLEISQAYAGTPGEGRKSLRHSTANK